MFYYPAHGSANLESGWSLPRGNQQVQTKSKNKIAHPLHMEGSPNNLFPSCLVELPPS